MGMYMREYWVQVHSSPIVYRYVDWSITVPLQMIEFNLILKAAGKPVSAGMFWRLLLGTVCMLLLDTWGRSTSSLLGLPSVLVWLAGDSFSTKSLLVKQVALLVAAVKLLRLPSTTCA